MVRFSKRAHRPKAVRQVTRQQFGEGILAFVLFAVVIGILGAGIAVPAVGAIGATMRAVPTTFEELPDDLVLVPPSEESRMLDSEGREIARFFSTKRIVIDFDQMAPTVKDAIVAIEDHRFYEHYGIDPDGLVRAAINNLNNRSTQGASTITQQFVKNMLMEKGIQEGDQDQIDAAQAPSLERKLREARYAMGLESSMSKDDILEGYLNIAPFGPNIHGVEAASKAYFSIGANELSVNQAALLAGLVQSPVEYDPLKNPEAAQARRDTVLAAMLEYDFITQEEYDQMVAVNIGDMLNPEYRPQGCVGAPDNMGYYCEYVIEEFLDDETYGETRQERQHLLDTGGLVLRTSINRKMQIDAYNSVIGLVPVYDNDGLDTVDTAIISVVPQNGYIVAMAQNTDFGIATEETPRSTMVSYNVYSDRGGGSGFQPGSTFKAFTLTQWFLEGRSAFDRVGGPRYYAPGSFTCDGEMFWTGEFQVGDLSGKDGSRTVMEAMSLSINQAIVSMATQVDYCQIFQRATDMGIVKEDGTPFGPENPTQLIGGADSVSPLLMASAYSTFANNGTRCVPMALLEVADRDGNVIKSYSPNCGQALDPTVANQVATVLKRTAATYPYQISRPFAAKSGTTDNNANTWMVGFTPQLATAAWAGFASNSSRPVQDMYINGSWYSEVFGGTFIGPMWTTYMEAATSGLEVKDIPEAFIGYAPTPAPATNPRANPNQNAGNPPTGETANG